MLHASTGLSSCSVISGISTASSGVVGTVSTSVGGILLLISKKKLLKCCELTDKITSSLVTSEVLISVSLNNDSVIDAKEFHKLQTLYLQVMTDVRNVDRKTKTQTEENFQKTILDEIMNLRKRHGTKIAGFSFCKLFNCLYYKNNL